VSNYFALGFVLIWWFLSLYIYYCTQDEKQELISNFLIAHKKKKELIRDKCSSFSYLLKTHVGEKLFLNILSQYIKFKIK